MIHLFTWNTPNGIKPLLMLEECGLDYKLHPIDISSGAQKADAFLTVNPNGRIPAMIDTDQPGSGAADGVEGLRLFSRAQSCFTWRGSPTAFSRLSRKHTPTA